MTLITAMSGSEKLSDGTSRLMIRVIPCRSFPAAPGLPEGCFLSEAVNAVSTVNAISRANRYPASQSGLPDQGYWYRGDYDIQDGQIIKLIGMRRAKSFGSVNRIEEHKAVLFIHIRAQGPLNRITLNTVNCIQSINVPVTVEGRFDILSLRQVGMSGGTIMSSDMADARPQYVDKVFTKTIIQPAIRATDAAQRVAVSTGGENSVIVASTRVRRAINMP